MSPVGGPMVPRRRLGAELRALRERAGLTIDAVARELECSRSKISRLETGKGIPYSRDVRDLLDRYEVIDQAQRDRLMRWVVDGRRQSWWSEYSDVRVPENPLVPSNFNHRYVGHEQDASEIRSFETTVVPVLLQTEDYARAVLRTLSTADRETTDRLVQFRMRRQDRLYVDDDPLIVHMLLDEAVLRRLVGGGRVMQVQLKRLLHDLQRPNITVQVLPFHIGAHCSVAGSFAILDLPDSDGNDLVYLESHVGDLYLEKKHDVQVYERLFDLLVDQCMTPERTTTLLQELVSACC